MDRDCDYCWGLEPPPLFRLPPPPRPPVMTNDEGCYQSEHVLMLAGEYYKSLEDSGDICRAFVMSGGEFQLSSAFPSVLVVIVSASLLTIVVLIAGLLIWRHRRRHYLPGTGSDKSCNLPLPTSTPGVNGIHDFYDEILSHQPVNFRHPTTPTLAKSYLPPMEMADILKLPCHSPALPLLSHQQSPQFAPSPHSSSTSPSQHSRDATGNKGQKRRSWQQHSPRRAHDRENDYEAELERCAPYHSIRNNHPHEETTVDSSGWVSDPIYEELSSGSADEEPKKPIRSPYQKESQSIHRLPTPLSNMVASVRSKSPLQQSFLTPRLDSEGGSERTNSQSQSAGETESLTSSSDPERPRYSHRHRNSGKHQRRAPRRSKSRSSKYNSRPEVEPPSRNWHTNPVRALSTPVPNMSEFVGATSRGELIANGPSKQGTPAYWKEYADNSHYANIDPYQSRLPTYYAPAAAAQGMAPSFTMFPTELAQHPFGNRTLPYRDHAKRSKTKSENASFRVNNREESEPQRRLEPNEAFSQTLFHGLKYLSPEHTSTLPPGLYRGKCPPEAPPPEVLHDDPRYVTTAVAAGRFGSFQPKERDLSLPAEQEIKCFTRGSGERV